MWMLATAASVVLIVAMLVDSFETTVLPRRVTHRFRFARLFYVTTWKLWRLVALWIPVGKWREAFLALFGPLSLLALLSTWVYGLILGFAVFHWSLGTDLSCPEKHPTFATYAYWSGVTFFTLGYGEVAPVTPFGRASAVLETGMGFGFLALIIGYLPVTHQTFSQREKMIALLDARAGSPPSAGELLVRAAQAGDMVAIDLFLAEWERWSAELLESHLSFPVLSFYRSQHDNQSWLSALTTVLDACAFLIAGVKSHRPYQAQLTFAIARHAAVDLALVLQTPPTGVDPDRLPANAFSRLIEQLRGAGLELQDEPTIHTKLAELRGMYEPFVTALARRCLFHLPRFATLESGADNWQRSAWMKPAPNLGNLPLVATGDGHFD